MGKDMGIPVQTLIDTHQQHYEASQKAAKDPDGGQWPAYPSGKSWDAASGPTGSGKKFYHNVIQGSEVAKQEFYVAIITPVIHYCMGGLEVTADAEVISKDGVIPGLYAAGEIAGGVHGNNRLGGNSLLDCVSLAVWLARPQASTSWARMAGSSSALNQAASRSSSLNQRNEAKSRALRAH